MEVRRVVGGGKLALWRFSGYVGVFVSDIEPLMVWGECWNGEFKFSS